jgi:transglutaminase-like putative cysteine protease
VLSFVSILLAASASNAAQTTVDLVATQAFASNSQGDPILPMIGDNIFVTLKYSVQGPLDKQYSVKIQAPYQTMQTPLLGFGIGEPGTYQVTWGPIPVLTDQAFTINASLVGIRGLREISTRNNSASFNLITARPVNAIEWFSQRNIQANLGLSVQWNRAPGQVQLFFPKIQTSSFQTVASQNLPSEFSESEAFFRNLDLGTAVALSQSSEISTLAWSQRINRDLVGASTFADYQFDSPQGKSWLDPEIYVESASPTLIQFANAARVNASAQTPFAIAESVYKSILARCSYTTTKPGKMPSALSAYKSKKADCGGLSSLFVAGCRANGIPARTVAGFTEGENQWHVWAEFYIANHGWIACDPAYAKGRMPKGTLPIYFGIMPDLNSRVATSFGFDVTAGGRTFGLLQGPSVFWNTSGVQATEGHATSSLISTAVPF